MPQQDIIDLPHDADIDDRDGDLYDMMGDYPPPYAPHDIVGHQSELSALVSTDRTSVGRIIVATIVVYVVESLCRWSNVHWRSIWHDQVNDYACSYLAFTDGRTRQGG